MRFLQLLKYLTVAFLIAFAGFAGAACAIYLLLPGFSDRLPLDRPTPSPTHLEDVPPETAQVVITDQDAITNAAQLIAPSVVTITDGRSSKPDSPTGTSGLLIDGRGYIVASQHAVAELKTLRVVFADDREFSAKLIGSHKGSDIAVVKIDADGDNFAAAPLGDSCLLRTGEWVVAVGSASADFEQTASVGVVSARGRPAATEDRSYDDLLQTDATINATNTGGPLINLNGEVVGVCTNTYAGARGAEGVGFAVPIEDVHTLVDEMIQDGKAHGTYLGMSVDDISEADAELLSLRSRAGALVRGILPGGPAAEAGLQRHDVITRFGGQRIGSANALKRLARRQRPNEEASVQFLRDGKQRTERIRVHERT